MDRAPELYTNRLILRAHRESDFVPLSKFWSDAATVEYITGKPSTESESWARLLRYAGQWPILGYGYWAITSKVDGIYLGEAGFLQIEPPLQPSSTSYPEAGWLLGRQHVGKGYAHEAVQRILQWSDETQSWGATKCVINHENLRSVALAKKLGYSASSNANSDATSCEYIRHRN